ncbi:MAG: hypothetical protein EPO61_13330 [Nitrospirae bacterium]|nr:MAG: hypothetical protein EPO61_13330 [Nitrospirota bacterium]
MTLRTLPLPFKILATCVLLTIGVGYLFALVYLYLMDLEPHAKHGVGLVQSVIVKYYGDRAGSALEAALEGSMGRQVTPIEKQQIIQWLRHGALEAEFVNVQPILKQSCARCHRSESGSSIPPLTTYAEVSAYATMDVGQSIKSLARVSHIHLFGVSFLFALTSLVFAFSETSRVFRSVLIAMPFLAIWLDIGSWWITKFDPVFAYTVIGGGVLMGLSLAGQISIALYEMWVK